MDMLADTSIMAQKPGTPRTRDARTSRDTRGLNWQV